MPESFGGAVVELHEYHVTTGEDMPRELLRFEVHGRSADGRPLTAADTQVPLDDDALVVGPDDAYERGIGAMLERLELAFPGAVVGFCPEGEDSRIPEIWTTDVEDLPLVLLVERETGNRIAGH